MVLVLGECACGEGGGREGGEWVNVLTISSQGVPDLRSRECLLIGQFLPHDSTPADKITSRETDRETGSYRAAHN